MTKPLPSIIKGILLIQSSWFIVAVITIIINKTKWKESKKKKKYQRKKKDFRERKRIKNLRLRHSRIWKITNSTWIAFGAKMSDRPAWQDITCDQDLHASCQHTAEASVYFHLKTCCVFICPIFFFEIGGSLIIIYNNTD